jgi:hypothetical protein
MALRSRERPPRPEEDGAPDTAAAGPARFVRAVVAVVVAIAAAAIWLCLLDRVGVVLVGGNAWCGARAVWLLYSCNAAVAAPVVVAFFAFRVLAAAVPRGRRIVLPIVGAVAGFVALGVLFVQLPLENVIPRGVALAMPFVGALLAGFAATLRTTRQNRYWQIGFAAALSILAGVIDSTVFPTLVSAAHVRAHAVTVVASVVGIGLPAGALLSERRGRWVPAAVLGATIAAASGLWVSLTAARGFVAAVSPAISRLLALLPGTAPAGVLRLTLSPRNAPDAEPRPRTEPPLRAPSSVILITVDALRADALRPAPGRASYMLPGDTPFVDRWIQDATWFDNAVSQGSSTTDALRSLMRGINSGDEHAAADIPAMAQRLGLRSAAVVPAFIRSDYLFQTGIERFDRAEFYDQRKQEQQLDLVEQVISDLGSDRFFLWTHFFGTHHPYYSMSGPRPLRFFIPPTEVGRLAAEYREAVRWLDAQLARLFRALEQKGLRNSTLVVLTADHGEHVGDGLLIGHGDALHEADIRVPLVFDVPGQAGAKVKTLVGSRDVLPTIVELLGGAPEPSHRGESLLPLMRVMRGRTARAPANYPIRGVLRSEYGVLTEWTILVYTPRLAAFQRFVRPPGVTSGSGDVFGRDRASDEVLMALLAGFEPNPFGDQLNDPSTTRLLVDRIGALSGHEATFWVDALIRIAQHSNAPEVRAALRKAFSATPQVDGKLRILAGAFARDEAHWTRELADLLAHARGSPTEAALVRAVEGLGLAGKVFAGHGVFRLAELRGQPAPELVDAWLSLLGASPRGADLVPVLTALSETVDPSSAAPREVLTLLRVVAALTLPAPRETAARLAAWVRPLIRDPREPVASAACAALGAVGSSEDAASTRQLVESARRVVIRRAAVRATARLQGSAAMDSLKVWAGDPVLAPTALGQIAQVGDRAALEWLQRQAGAQSDALRGELLHQTISELQVRLAAPVR